MAPMWHRYKWSDKCSVYPDLGLSDMNLSLDINLKSDLWRLTRNAISHDILLGCTLQKNNPYLLLSKFSVYPGCTLSMTRPCIPFSFSNTWILSSSLLWCSSTAAPGSALCWAAFPLDRGLFWEKHHVFEVVMETAHCAARWLAMWYKQFVETIITCA